ncbi:MAG: nucleotidyltransferase domain-containing protein [Candidatus Fermentithermobacillus carboniphilus]|uniref:Nucleotidyltransferase domain-containing protein n=1 Tax=Candidatus Fermentithermobacillus carboniphilus TaxID=3085328 RepID=A0AAT9LEZ2_9FIRM|nr:MAG: nucleotidyltransferase domain-containing protein [Candidatus Fermentithermobacillus carboniphilus]
MGTKDAVNLLRSPGFAALCHRHGVSLAVLFGSQARGRATDASDIDLAVLMEDKGYARDLLCLARERRQFMKDLITYLQTADVDLVILNHANPLLRFQVAKTGKPVYEGMPGLFAQFCSLAVRQHEDSKVFYQAMDRYLKQAAQKRGYHG